MTEPLSPERLAEIRERLAAATPGPWDRRTAPREGNGIHEKAEWCTGTLTDNGEPLHLVIVETPDDPAFAYIVPALTGDGPTSEANADLIANAPDDLAYLLTEVERLREAEARVRALHQQYRPAHRDDTDICTECSQYPVDVPWPCPTIRALDGEVTP